ncbi:MAG: hypothetical protein QXZ59_04125, partial [Nitrososphaeria archaeon]
FDKKIVNEIKEEFREVNAINGLLELDQDSVKSIQYLLLEASRKKDKNMFLYILLHTLNTKKEICANRSLIEYIHKKIICNTSSYYIYGLALLIGLLRRR